MPAVTRDFIRAFNPVARAIFQDAYMPVKTVWEQIATLIDSTLPQEDYTFLGAQPVMVQWKDERQIKQLAEFGYSVANQKYEATIGIQREALEDDRLGMIKFRIQQLAEAAKRHYDQILFAAISANGNAYDGNPFFSAGRATSNLLSGGGSALSATSIATAIANMRKQKLDNGEPIDVTPTHLLVPPDLEWTARTILNSAFYPDATGKGQMAANVWAGTMELAISPRLTTATEWYIFDCSHGTKPFIVQQRVPVTFEWLDSDKESDTVFTRDEFLYGVRSRDAVAYGLYQYAIKSAGV